MSSDSDVAGSVSERDILGGADDGPDEQESSDRSIAESAASSDPAILKSDGAIPASVQMLGRPWVGQAGGPLVLATPVAERERERERERQRERERERERETQENKHRQ